MGLVRGIVDSGISKAEGVASYAADKIPQSTVYVAKVKAYAPGTVKRVSGSMAALSATVDTVDAKVAAFVDQVSKDEKVLRVQELRKKATVDQTLQLCKAALQRAQAEAAGKCRATVVGLGAQYQARKELCVSQAAGARDAALVLFKALEGASVADLRLVQQLVAAAEGTKYELPLARFIGYSNQVIRFGLELPVRLEIPRPLRTYYARAQVLAVSVEPKARLAAVAERGCFYAGRLQAEAKLLCTQAEQQAKAKQVALLAAVEQRLQASAAAELRTRATKALEGASKQARAAKPAVWAGCVRVLGEDRAASQYAQWAPRLPGVVSVWLDLQ